MSGLLTSSRGGQYDTGSPPLARRAPFAESGRSGVLMPAYGVGDALCPGDMMPEPPYGVVYRRRRDHGLCRHGKRRMRSLCSTYELDTLK